jgi:calcium-dependent protein kinase
MYASSGSKDLKLIDFGFSKFFDVDFSRLTSTCGTLSYVAPEVLKMKYGSQCDLWSAGVIAFILLTGSMPFHGNKEEKIAQIRAGDYAMDPELWRSVPDQAKDFTRGLLQKDPKTRLTAQRALGHGWMRKFDNAKSQILEDPSYVGKALTSWSSAPKLRRACFTLLAWNLPDSERAKYRDSFLALDTDHNGLISYQELKQLMVSRCNVDESQFGQIFQSLDSNQDDVIHYSEFAAAMICEHMEEIDSSLLKTTFRQFDRYHTGYITKEDFSEIVGHEYDGTNSIELLLEADVTKDGRIDYDEFHKYMSESGKVSSWYNAATSSGTSSKHCSSRHSKPRSTALKTQMAQVYKSTDKRSGVDAPNQGCCTLM